MTLRAAKIIAGDGLGTCACGGNALVCTYLAVCSQRTCLAISRAEGRLGVGRVAIATNINAVHSIPSRRTELAVEVRYPQIRANAITSSELVPVPIIANTAIIVRAGDNFWSKRGGVPG